MKNLIYRYSTFIKYLFSAGTSFLLDLGLFKIFTSLFRIHIGDYSIFVGTVLARVISSFYNYFMNRNAVFKVGKKGMDTTTFTKYALLVFIQMGVSSLLVFFGHRLIGLEETIVKIPVDVFLFLVNYVIQKKFIFHDHEEEL